MYTYVDFQAILFIYVLVIHPLPGFLKEAISFILESRSLENHLKSQNVLKKDDGHPLKT